MDEIEGLKIEADKETEKQEEELSTFRKEIFELKKVMEAMRERRKTYPS